MTVESLIEELLQYPLDMEVWFHADDFNANIDTVATDGQTVELSDSELNSL